MGLCRDDRLEPSLCLMDISKFESASIPIEVLFWRGGKDDRVTHDTPLFWIEGVGPETLHIDLLHTWHLGPATCLVAFTCWFMIRAQVFHDAIPVLDMAENDRLGVLILRSEMWQFYKQHAQEDPEWEQKNSKVF